MTSWLGHQRPRKSPTTHAFFTQDVHISPDGKALIGEHGYTPAAYADMLHRSGYGGQQARPPDRLRRGQQRHRPATLQAPRRPSSPDEARVDRQRADRALVALVVLMRQAVMTDWWLGSTGSVGVTGWRWA